MNNNVRCDKDCKHCIFVVCPKTDKARNEFSHPVKKENKTYDDVIPSWLATADDYRHSRVI